MFEAVTTAFWMGAVLAFAMELFVRKGGMRSMFALGASVASMFAMMAAYFTPKMDLFFTLDPNIRNMMPVLHDIWLYIHTNVIIASYAIIFMAAVTGALYLLRRALGGPADHAPLGGTAALLRASIGTAKPGASNDTKSLGEILDGATMVLIELSFVLLWAGIIMGAIWADHSWGRPWGWDPKEVFALNTFLVYLILVHVRIKSKDKGLWTAVLAVVGCAVMLFNWLVINFVISGLHSYA
jgi:cytochrome c-type biogenesis protein CcsB